MLGMDGGTDGQTIIMVNKTGCCPAARYGAAAPAEERWNWAVIWLEGRSPVQLSDV